MFSNSEHQVPFWYQALWVLLTLTIFSAITYVRVKQYRPHDPSVAVTTITPKLLTDFGESQSTVRAGLYISEFPKFDIVKNEFSARGIIWFECDPLEVSVETLEKFALLKGDFSEKILVGSSVENGKLFIRYSVKFSFSTPLDYQDFPYDDHQIQLVLANRLISPSEIIFESAIREFIVAANLRVFGWNAVNRNVYPGIIKEQLDEFEPDKAEIFPVVRYVVDCSFTSVRNILTVIVPLLLIFFVGLSVFSFDPAKHTTSIISVVTTSVGAILAYRFVIQNVSPNVGYFMVSDYIFLIILGLSIANFFLVLTFAHRSAFFKKFIVAGMHLCIIGAMVQIILL